LKLLCRLVMLAVFASASPLVVAGEDLLPEANSGAAPFHCNPWKSQIFSANLSFAERVCLDFSQLASPSVLAGSAAMAGWSQWRNNPHMRRTDSDDIAVRFEHLYERRSARITGEFLAGYLHHEDPRFHPSGKQGVWRRTGAALLSVMESPDENGKARMAFAPLAGSLGSGLTTMALYQRQNSIGYGLERSGIVYSRYLARALYHEFSPDLWSLAPKFIRKHHTPDSN